MEVTMRACRILLIACAAFVLAACGGRAAHLATSNEVRVEVDNVGYDQESGTHYVLLEDHADGRTLPIMIGQDEARAIMFELHGIKPQRPLTYQLLQEVIHRTGNHVDRVVITTVHDEVYFARVVLDGGRYVVDSRPSDAIALAVGLKAPIFVNEQLFGPAPGNAAQPAPIRMATGLGLTVQELGPELAQYFGVPPGSGVIVADLDSAAARAGMMRGDIVTAVGHHHVTTPEQFAALVATATTSNVILTVRRGNGTHQVRLGGVHIGTSPSR
jgi:bifunctional DNase/RNase